MVNIIKEKEFNQNNNLDDSLKQKVKKYLNIYVDCCQIAKYLTCLYFFNFFNKKPKLKI